MTKFLRPTEDGHGYTKGKLYRAEREYGNNRFDIENDNGYIQTCRADGYSSIRLYGVGAFEVVTSDDVTNDMFLKAGECAIAGYVTAGKNLELMELADKVSDARREAREYKRDLLKAEALIDQLYDMFTGTRNHDQLLAAIKRSKIFADAFLELQKAK